MNAFNAIDVPADETSVGLVGILFAVFAVFFILVVLLMIISAVRRVRVAKEEGVDPFAADIQAMGAVTSSAVLAPDRTIPERLAEVDALHASGAITDTEYDEARARIISSL